MQKNFILSILSIFLLVSCSSKPKTEEPQTEKLGKLGKTPIVLAYVTSGSTIMPDPDYVTHINYAFGYVNDTFNGVIIQNQERLKEITQLKVQHPDLRVMLSIGGWTSGKFSEMAATDSTRKSFAKDCKRIVDEFNLDGIDMDWEYPTSSEAGISSSPADKDNFTTLMKDIREAIGENKLLTLASAYTAQYYDFKAIEPYMDFINIMTYDMGRPPYHNSPLYRSEHTYKYSVEESVQMHIDAGFPAQKLTLGIPFYGHAIKEISDFIDFKVIGQLDEKYTQKWDSLGQVPYYADKDGKFICSFDNAKSVELKSKFAIEKGLLGVMYWEYGCDDENGTLRKATYNATREKQ